MNNRRIERRGGFHHPFLHVYKYIGLLCLCIVYALDANCQYKEEETSHKGHKFVYADQVGKPYIPFQVTTFDGRVINNENSMGKVTFINFWFMGCRGCVAEFGQLNKIYAHYVKNASFQFVAVTYDAPKDLPEYLDKYKIKFPVACVSTPESRRMYGVGYPTSLIIDKQGNIAYLNLGSIDTVKKNTRYSTSIDSIFCVVNKLLKN